MTTDQVQQNVTIIKLLKHEVKLCNNRANYGMVILGDETGTRQNSYQIVAAKAHVEHLSC